MKVSLYQRQRFWHILGLALLTANVVCVALNWYVHNWFLVGVSVTSATFLAASMLRK